MWSGGWITDPVSERSLESRIGSQWFNRIGILAVLIGMALFLKLAIDNHWVGPLGRVLIGLLAGIGFIAWSERFQHQGYKAFAYSLKAVGSGILYLSLWAAFSLFHLTPAAVAFTAMVLVTAFNGYMAWIEDAELLAVYSIAGGLSTPLLVSTGGNHEVSLFTYLLILNSAVLVLVTLRPWSRLLLGAFTGSVVFFSGWWFAYYSNVQFVRTACFAGSFFLLFAFAPRLVRLELQVEDGSKWDRLVGVLMPIANAGLGFLTFYAIFNRSSAEWGHSLARRRLCSLLSAPGAPFLHAAFCLPVPPSCRSSTSQQRRFSGNRYSSESSRTLADHRLATPGSRPAVGRSARAIAALKSARLTLPGTGARRTPPDPHSCIHDTTDQ